MRFYWKYRVRQILFWGWGIFVGGGVQYIFMWVTLLLLFYLSLYQQVFMWNCPFPPTLHEREYEKSLPSIKNSHMEQNTCLFFFFLEGREMMSGESVKPRLTLNLQFSCFCFPSAQTTGVYYHAWLKMLYWDICVLYTYKLTYLLYTVQYL